MKNLQQKREKKIETQNNIKAEKHCFLGKMLICFSSSESVKEIKRCLKRSEKSN